MSAEVVLRQMMIIFAMIMIGYFSCKKGFLKTDASKGISALVVNLCNPAMLVRSSFNRDPSITYEKLLLAVLAGGVLYVLLLVSSVIIPRILRVEKKWKNHYALMCLFGNNGFIGIPLTAAVLGNSAVIYVAIMNAYYNLLFYTYGIYLSDDGKGKFEWKNMMNMGNLSILMTILIFAFQPKLPEIFTSTVGYMADTTTFLAMVVIGISLAKSKVFEIFTQIRQYGFILLRFVILPILISFVMRLFIKDDMIFGVMVLMAAVPVGNLPLMRVEEIGGDGRVISSGIILSTILSLITIPLVVALV